GRHARLAVATGGAARGVGRRRGVPPGHPPGGRASRGPRERARVLLARGTKEGRARARRCPARRVRDRGRAGEAGRGGTGPGRRGGENGRWRLVATHRAGSIDDVVAAARERNLAVSFGVLALLGASTALVVLTAQRARRLGERQMEFVAGVSHELRTPVAV